MKIQGHMNDDENVLRIIVNFEEEGESQAFQEAFFNMMKQMASDNDGVMIDPDGEVVVNATNFNGSLEQFAKQLAIATNKNVAVEYQNKFI